MVNSFILGLLEVAKETNLSFDEVFKIAFDYGIIDQNGNVTKEVLKQKKETK